MRRKKASNWCSIEFPDYLILYKLYAFQTYLKENISICTLPFQSIEKLNLRLKWNFCTHIPNSPSFNLRDTLKNHQRKHHFHFSYVLAHGNNMKFAGCVSCKLDSIRKIKNRAAFQNKRIYIYIHAYNIRSRTHTHTHPHIIGKLHGRNVETTQSLFTHIVRLSVWHIDILRRVKLDVLINL